MRTNGFTLIELLITFAIVAIITAIAVPQYTAYRNKEIRTDAVRSMLKLSMELERCRSRNGDGTYTNCPNVGNVTASLQGHYTISINLNNNDTGFSMTGTKIVSADLSTADLECSSLTLTHDGLRDAASNNSSLNTAKKRIQRCWGS